MVAFVAIMLGIVILFFFFKKKSFFYSNSKDKFYDFTYNTKWIILALILILLGVVYGYV